MAYQTGVSTGTHDLLDKLRLFAAGIGWTIDRFATGVTVGYDDNGTWLQLHHADAGYHNIAADNLINDINTFPRPSPYIYCFGATGVDLESTLFKDQPGSSWTIGNYQETGNINGVGGACGTNGLRGPFTAYHFFGTTDYLHVCIEIVAGEYAHFGVGKMEKNGVYTGGEYGFGTPWYYYLNTTSNYANSANHFRNAWFFDATYSHSQPISCSGYMRMDHPDYPGVPQWGRASSSQSAASNSVSAASKLTSSYGEYRNPFSQMWMLTPNTINGISPMFPIAPIFQLRNTYCFMPGQLKDVRFVNIINLDPGTTVTLGTDAWLVFPIKAKGTQETGPKGTVNSWRYGVAYRKVT